MSTSNADKPPIHSPPPESVEPLQLTSSDEHEVVAEVVELPPPRPVAETLLHWTFLIMAVVIVAASLSLQIRGRGQVVVPIVNASLPGTCTFRKISGVPCPGCGLTRSFISMGHGRIGDAWRFNPAGFFFFAVVAFQIPYRTYQIARIRRGRGPHRFEWIDNWVLIALVVVLLMQWFWGLLFG